MFSKLCRVGNDPEVRFTPSGDAVMNLSLAYAYGRKGDDGKRPTQWVEASMWGKQAESLAPYIKKGDQVSVSIDDLHIETYPKKDGSEGFKLMGRIAAFDFVGGGKSDNEPPKPKPQNEDDNPDIPF